MDIFYNSIMTDKVLARLRELRGNFLEKEKNHSKRESRMRTSKSLHQCIEKRKLYRALWKRCNDLIYACRDVDPVIRYEVEQECIRSEYKARLRRKEEKKQLHLSSHKYSLHFFSNSLNADYGTFVCERCGCEFYHSPSTILLAGKVIYQYCCGYCTNAIIQADWGEQVYE